MPAFILTISFYFIIQFTLIKCFERPPEVFFDLLSSHYYLVIENSFCKVSNRLTLSILGFRYTEVTNISSIHKTSFVENKQLECPISFTSHYSSCDGYRNKVLAIVSILTNNIPIVKSVQYIGRYFNPSIIYYRNNFLMFQREINSGAVLSNITRNYQIINEVEYESTNPLKPYENDIRIIEKPNKELLLVYTDDLDHPNYEFPSIRYMKHNRTNNKFYLTNQIKLDDSSMSLREKNWVPFIYKFNVYFIQKVFPLTILKLSNNPIFSKNISYFSNRYIDTIKVDYVSIDKCSKMYYLNGASWDYGEIRGGTPAQYIPILNGYLSFFHSFTSVCSREYFFGAYVFSHSIPFRMLKMSHQPILNDDLYVPHQLTTNKFHWIVLFPMSFYLEHSNGTIIKDGSNMIPSTVVISAGTDDSNGTVIKLDFNRLIDSLVDVTCS